MWKFQSTHRTPLLFLRWIQLLIDRLEFRGYKNSLLVVTKWRKIVQFCYTLTLFLFIALLGVLRVYLSALVKLAVQLVRSLPYSKFTYSFIYCRCLKKFGMLRWKRATLENHCFPSFYSIKTLNFFALSSGMKQIGKKVSKLFGIFISMLVGIIYVNARAVFVTSMFTDDAMLICYTDTVLYEAFHIPFFIFN